MDIRSVEDMNRHYSSLLQQHGDNLAALVYRDPEQQRKRFALLTAVEPIGRQASVLDVGCGLGHLCDYLRAVGWQGTYTGIDINPDMCAAAKRRLPAEEFLSVDLLGSEFTRQFDYVFCGAAIEHRPKYDDPEWYWQRMVERMFSLTRQALAFDVFSGRADYYDDDKLYVDPAVLLAYCYGLTPRVTLRNDCRPFELMLYLYRPVATNEFNIFSAWREPQPQIVDE